MWHNKALGSDATPRTSCALFGAGQPKRYGIKLAPRY